jgi:squalene-hopene/tetraprenyl-beta-curcumene cyclase
MTSRGNPPCLASDRADLLKAFNRLNGSAILERDPDVDNILEEAIKLYGPKGTFGAYSISTLLTLMAFKDYSLRYDDHQNEYITFYNKNLNKSMSFVEELYFNRRVPYEGSLDDGRYWDTILATYGLLEAGESPEKLHPTLEYIINNVIQPNGGIPYGLDFEYAPDIDDTGMLIVLYGKLKEHYRNTPLFDFYDKAINHSYGFVRDNQNSDGGYPAFHKNKNDGQYKFWTFIFWMTQIDKSAEIFDPSCPDIVGHVFEGMAAAGVNDT